MAAKGTHDSCVSGLKLEKCYLHANWSRFSIPLVLKFRHDLVEKLTYSWELKSKSKFCMPQGIIRRIVPSSHRSDQKESPVRTFLLSFPQHRKQCYKTWTAWCSLPLGGSCQNATLPSVVKGPFIPSCISQATGLARMLGMLPVNLGHKESVVCL